MKYRGLKLAVAATMALTLSAVALPARGAQTPRRLGKYFAYYEGKLNEKWVYDPKDPSVERSTLEVIFDEAVDGTYLANGKTAYSKPELELSGYIIISYGSGSGSCEAEFSPRPGYPNPFVMADYGVVGSIPVAGMFAQSSAPAASNCSLPKNGSIGEGGVAWNGASLQKFLKAEAPDCSYNAAGKCSIDFDDLTYKSDTNTSSFTGRFAAGPEVKEEPNAVESWLLSAIDSDLASRRPSGSSRSLRASSATSTMGRRRWQTGRLTPASPPSRSR
jgi:hypothetical protein